MTAPVEYPKDFVEKTKKIIEDHFDSFKTSDREFTFLLNCLLGLVITVNEKRGNKFNGEIDADFLKFIPEKIGFIDLPSNQTDLLSDTTIINIKKHSDLISKTKVWFLGKIRNGIAHQHIKVEENDGNWTGIRLWNIKNKNKDFEIIFTQKELKDLAIEIASIYLAD